MYARAHVYKNIFQKTKFLMLKNILENVFLIYIKNIIFFEKKFMKNFIDTKKVLIFATCNWEKRSLTFWDICVFNNILFNN